MFAQDLEKELEDSIECLRQVGILLEKYSGAQNEACYFDMMNQVVDHYGRLYSMRGAVTDRVPVEVMEEYLDKGLSPELYTKHRLKYADDQYQVFLSALFCPLLCFPVPFRRRVSKSLESRPGHRNSTFPPQRVRGLFSVLTYVSQQNKGRVDSLKLLHDHVQREVERRLGPSPVVKRIQPPTASNNPPHFQ